MSVIAELKTKIDQEEREKLAANWEAYRGVLQRLHDGEDVEPGKVKSSLDALGKPFDDLELDLERMRYRISLRAKQQAAKESKPKLPALQGELEKRKTERQKAIDNHNLEIEAVISELTRLRRIVSEGEQAPRLLHESCQNPALKSELEANEGRLRYLHGERNIGQQILHGRNLPTSDEVDRWSKHGATVQDAISELNTIRDAILRRMELD